MANKFFPVSIDLNNKNVLIIGAGKIALRKTETLLNYNCNITVITKDILEEKFLELEKNNRIKIFKNQKFEEKFLENIFLVIAATDNEVLNKNISQLCMSKNVLVNNITSKDDMNVRFASIYEKDDIQIAISANANPKKAAEIKNKIKNIFEK
ncbi:bifunctional precorrin-2 dehydrogenase/sirohydrochlorin ferrochelatase [Fusobacterium nucleatum]|uniref:precorrin-2 dehydrogenase/sirohydrochlorin ferrochelatase family protein n=1 Tax=Fusobacterium nucleatum TaxID=851 RepID=UPI00287736B1|nr:bifunctional precorrin-2 dehydrogenase/sirohydrochlorin ferrochelatase [Fusobacterium nucleatum]